METDRGIRNRSKNPNRLRTRKKVFDVEGVRHHLKTENKTGYSMGSGRGSTGHVGPRQGVGLRSSRPEEGRRCGVPVVEREVTDEKGRTLD